MNNQKNGNNVFRRLRKLQKLNVGKINVNLSH